jgi:hypothetical protein
VSELKGELQDYFKKTLGQIWQSALKMKMAEEIRLKGYFSSHETLALSLQGVRENVLTSVRKFLD